MLVDLYMLLLSTSTGLIIYNYFKSDEKHFARVQDVSLGGLLK